MPAEEKVTIHMTTNDGGMADALMALTDALGGTSEVAARCDYDDCEHTGPWAATVDEAVRLAREVGWDASVDNDSFCPAHAAPNTTEDREP